MEAEHLSISAQFAGRKLQRRFLCPGLKVHPLKNIALIKLKTPGNGWLIYDGRAAPN